MSWLPFRRYKKHPRENKFPYFTNEERNKGELPKDCTASPTIADCPAMSFVFVC